MPEEKPKFNLLKQGNPIKDDRGNVLFTSIQEIVQPNGSKSSHLVISKVRNNLDGTPASRSKGLFIPLSLASHLTKTIEALVK